MEEKKEDREESKKFIAERLEAEELKPARKDRFSIRFGNLGGFKRKIADVREWMKIRVSQAKKRKAIRYIDSVYLSSKQNAIYLCPGYYDDYNVGFNANRPILKEFDNTKILTLNVAGTRSETALFDDFHLSNVSIPQITKLGEDEKEILSLFDDIERARERLIQDDVHRTKFKPDDRQMRLLLLAIIFSFLGGLGSGVLGSIWLGSTGII